MRSCEQYAQEVKDSLKDAISKLEDKPCLVILQVGDNPASNSYVKGKIKDCEEVGISCHHFKYKEDTSMDYVIETIEIMNNDPRVDGIIVQLPLPKHIDVDKVTEAIAKEKDVDGFKPGSPFDPCTPKGIIDWLEYNEYDFEGAVACVIGRSNIVGKPLVNMLIDRGATVTCCNSNTVNLPGHTIPANLIISAIGKPRYLPFWYFQDNQVIVDVGINRDANGKLCGDVDRENVLVENYNAYVTPVPKGVGLLTRVALLKNVVAAYENREVKANEELGKV
jgi:methylenetetrahydrofolate dehydrogenase (NADP+)/methenyltetrahydrofolate cyclohydrolase